MVIGSPPFISHGVKGHLGQVNHKAILRGLITNHGSGRIYGHEKPHRNQYFMVHVSHVGSVLNVAQLQSGPKVTSYK